MELKQQVILFVIQAVPVAYEDLPVTLPPVTQFHGHDGVSPLASAEQWLTTKCAKYSTVNDFINDNSLSFVRHCQVLPVQIPSALLLVIS